MEAMPRPDIRGVAGIWLQVVLGAGVPDLVHPRVTTVDHRREIGVLPGLDEVTRGICVLRTGEATEGLSTVPGGRQYSGQA